MTSTWSPAGYIELGELGRGGFGRVVLARRVASGARVAVKYLATEYLGDKRLRAQFRAEAAMLSRLANPHVVRLHEFVEEPDGAAIVMELVDGVALRQLLAEFGGTVPEAALAVLKGSLLGLMAAHSVGVVHRDYKPENVLVRGDGASTLVDFGIAVLAGDSGDPVGTPSYMAPEQWGGRPASPATDVYAATCVFFECVTGSKPFLAGDKRSLREQHRTASVPLRDVPEPVRDLIVRGMAKDPEQRPISAGSFIAELEAAAVAGYGPGWESNGKRHLAEAAGALAALFPLALLAGALLDTGAGSGGAAGHALGGGTGGKALLGKSGVKAGLALVGAAAVGGAVLIAVNSPGDDPPEARPRAVATPTPTPAGKPLDLGNFSVSVPATWKYRSRPQQRQTMINVKTPGKCHSRVVSDGLALPNDDGKAICPGFMVVKPSSFRASSGFKFNPSRPYVDEARFAGGIYNCPPNPKLVALGVKDGAKLTSKGVATIGSQQKAEYREWNIPCYKYGTDGNLEKSGVFYTERTWYSQEPRILVVDNWKTPGLAEILRTAELE